MPPLLNQYFLSDFHISDFAIANQHMMNEEYLRTYVDNNCAQEVNDIVKDMFDDHKISIKISKDFPNDKLFSIMKPYLSLYFISNYSLNEFKKRLHFKILHRKLHEFFTFNPNFGKKKVRFIEVRPFSKLKKIEHYFDENHIVFNESIDCQNSAKYFMKSHLCKKEFNNRNLFSVPSITRTNRIIRHSIIVNESDNHYSERYSHDEDEYEEEHEYEEEEEEEEANSESENEREYPQYNSVQQEYHQYDSESDSESDSNTPILEDSDIES
jgi:hypothetical protein